MLFVLFGEACVQAPVWFSRTLQLVHGSFDGSSDPLDSSSVLSHNTPAAMLILKL